MKLCPHPGCTNAVTDNGHCAQHARPAEIFSGMVRDLGAVFKALASVAVVLFAGFLAYEGYQALATPGKVFDRFREGDCYVTFMPNGTPGTWVTKVLGKTTDGAYILYDVVPAGGHREHPGADRMTEDAFRFDEKRYGLKYQKVTCP